MEVTAENKVGYKKTKLGWIPDDWQEVRLDALVSRFIVPMRDKPKNLTGDIPWCRIEDFEGKYLYNSKSGQGVSEEVVDEMNLKVYPEGTVLVSCSANLGKSAIVGRPLVTNQTFIGLVPISNNVDKELLYYIMITSADRLNRLSTGTTISYLSREEFERFKIVLPNSLPEQQKIATILSTWDKAIDKLSNLISEKEAFKKGLMQQLLTGKKRFPGFTDEWKEVKLGNVFDKIVGGGTPSRSNAAFWGDEFFWCTVKDFTNFNPNGTQEMITQKGLDKSSSNLIPKGTIITPTRMALGKVAIFNVDVAINQDLKALFLKDNVFREFVFYWFVFNSENIERMGTGSTVKGITLDQLKSLNMKLPSNFEEQKKIASTFSAADKEIELLNQELNNLQQQKKGLMQELLTGKVRVYIK